MTDQDSIPDGWRGDAVSAYPKSIVGRLKVRRPRWGGRHGSVVRGTVKWNGDGYRVVYSFLLGYETTLRASETYALWFMAMNAYREHDRTVRERQKLEDFRAVERVL